MNELRNMENRRKKRFGRLRELFENVQTMRMLNYSVEQMVEALTERHPDEVFFANQYLEAHRHEDLQAVTRRAYELLYSEKVPILKPKKAVHKPEVPEVDAKTMMERCAEHLIRAFIRDRVELITSLLANDKFDMREFAGWGYDRHYIETMVRTVKLFSPTVEIKQEMLQDRKRMQAIIDRIYEELYVLTKRTKIWTCDWLDFGNLKIYEGEE